MKMCSKCQTKNDDVSRFCKQCGTQFSDPSLHEKREKVLGGQKKSPWKLVVLILAVFVLGGIAYWIIQEKTSSNPTVGSPGVSGAIDYTGQTIRMTDIIAKVEKGNIAIPLNAVKDNKIVRFEYEGKGVKVPLLSYMTLAGRVVTAISMCEPCRSTRFHIQDKTLVCNACYTEWNLETLQGIKGGCMNYPPEVIPNTVENDQILIDEKLVVNWKPRV
ncbi:MAG: Fe-S-containing protein [Desulfobacterales bacterium]|nr:Fe-S-containing protein [Desulfobacterales bacterium]